MTVLIDDLRPLVKKNLAPIVVSALNDPGPGNELGTRRISFIGLMAALGNVDFVEGGEHAQELIIESERSATAAFVDSDDVMGNATPGEHDEVHIDWKQARDVVKVKRIDRAKSRGMQLYQWEDMWTQQTAMKLKTLLKLAEIACLQSNGAGAFAKSLYGIPYYIADTGTLGDTNAVDRAVETWAKSIIVDASSGGGSKLTVALMRQLRDAMEEQRGYTPDAYLCNRNIATQWQEELEGASRARVEYNSLAIGDSEFQVLFFDGVPIIPLPQYPTNRIDGINFDMWQFKVLLDQDEDDDPFQVEEIEAAGFPFQMHALPVTTSHYAAELEWFPQLTCPTPWNQGGIINITTV